MKKKLPLLLILLLLAAGLGVLLYPALGAYISKSTSTAAVSSYQGAVEKLDTTEQDAMLAAARAYNAALSGPIDLDPFGARDGEENPAQAEYDALLNVDGVMGYLEIPAVNIYLPVYHGTSEEVLQRGVGHLTGSGLPVGGAGVHSVLSAHRGLPNAKLFTDLDQLEAGDLFYVHVLYETLAYEVDQIKVVVPEEFHDLDPVPGQDYVTLLTCTPYGINSHRMLVRGHRVPYVQEEVKTAAARNIVSELTPVPAWLLALAALALMLPVRALALRQGRGREKRPSERKNDHESTS